jgi:hypothetical protein
MMSFATEVITLIISLRPCAAEVLILIVSFCDVKTLAALRAVDVFFRDWIDNLQAV